MDITCTYIYNKIITLLQSFGGFCPVTATVLQSLSKNLKVITIVTIISRKIYQQMQSEELGFKKLIYEQADEMNIVWRIWI